MEINNTFYRLPKAETFTAWREQAPDGFRYAVKANRYLTQAKKLKDCEEPLQRMMKAFGHLGDRLGPVLYQLPPHFELNLERLERFLAIAAHGVANVFEFRDPSWYTDKVFALLDLHGAGFCIHDMPGSVTPRMAVGGLTYLRFHGGVGKYRGRYPEERLLDHADWIARESRKGRPVWAYFNNDPEAHAIQDALNLRTMVAQALGTGSGDER